MDGKGIALIILIIPERKSHVITWSFGFLSFRSTGTTSSRLSFTLSRWVLLFNRSTCEIFLKNEASFCVICNDVILHTEPNYDEKSVSKKVRLCQTSCSVIFWTSYVITWSFEFLSVGSTRTTTWRLSFKLWRWILLAREILKKKWGELLRHFQRSHITHSLNQIAISRSFQRRYDYASHLHQRFTEEIFLHEQKYTLIYVCDPGDPSHASLSFTHPNVLLVICRVYTLEVHIILFLFSFSIYFRGTATRISIMLLQYSHPLFWLKEICTVFRITIDWRSFSSVSRIWYWHLAKRQLHVQ